MPSPPVAPTVESTILLWSEPSTTQYPKLMRMGQVASFANLTGADGFAPVFDGVETMDVIALSSGVYTPTLTGVTNVAASTAFQCQYLRVGSVVTVSGKVSVDPTATGLVQLGISLPVPSNIGAAEDCGGTAFASGIAGQGAAILGDAANNRAEMDWIAVDVSNQAMFFSFAYRII